MTTTRDYLLDNKPDERAMILLEWIRTEFNLPPSMVDVCDNYFLRVWDGQYVFRQFLGNALQHAGDAYIVHWQSTPEVVKSAARVACSFREYQCKKYVVIKVWNQEANK